MFSTQRVKFITLVTLFTFSLSACASKPYVPPVMKPTDRNLTCGDLDTEMKQAMQYKQMARKDDTFQWRYVLIIPAFLSVYNWHKAEKAADERIDYLESLSRQRGCAMGGGGFGAANPMMMQQMPSFPGGSNPTMPMRQNYPMQSPNGGNPALGFAPSGVNPATNPLAPRGGTAPTGQYYTNKMSGQAIHSVPTRYEPSGAFALPRSMQMQRKTMPQQQQAQPSMYGSMPPNMMMRQPSMQPTTTRPNIPQYGGYAAPSQPTMSAPNTRTPVPNYQQFNNNYAPRATSPSPVMARNPNAAAPYPSYGYQPQQQAMPQQRQQQIPTYAQQQRPSPSYTVPNQKASTAGYMY